LLANLLRVETFFRDSISQTLKQKTKFNSLVTVIYITEHMQINFKFGSRQLTQLEGAEVQAEGKNTFLVRMGPLCWQSVLAEIRSRVARAL